LACFTLAHALLNTGGLRPKVIPDFTNKNSQGIDISIFNQG
jgi:hypothetical protein